MNVSTICVLGLHRGCSGEWQGQVCECRTCRHGVDELTAAKAARDAAVETVGQNADPAWKDRAFEAVTTLAKRQPTLIANDIWTLVERPREPRATGAVMQAARRAELIEPTDSYVPVPSRKSHAAPVRVWRSLIYRGQP